MISKKNHPPTTGRPAGWGEASLPSRVVRRNVGTTVQLRREAIGLDLLCRTTRLIGTIRPTRKLFSRSPLNTKSVDFLRGGILTEIQRGRLGMLRALQRIPHALPCRSPYSRERRMRPLSDFSDRGKSRFARCEADCRRLRGIL